MNWYLVALQKYADFQGRARRKEYWFFTLFNLLFVAVAILLDHLTGLAFDGIGYGPIYLFYALALFVPGLAVAVRRLHDVGKNGWMVLISLIPIVGGIWLLILLLTEGHPQENEYGPAPKQLQENTDNVALTEHNNTADNILLIVVGWFLASKIIWLGIPFLIKLTGSDIQTYYIFASLFTQIITAATITALGYVVKNKTKQIIVYIVGAIYFFFTIATTVMQYLEMERSISF
ncbi:DUF805 domain-containing protein [Fulvivirga sp. 29W222]|uniref:DUF805 domain-containing protein n=1 Tax=Fulvivirga marina TaxID=2494733 RepID=A0A937FXC5_9BACT|nr:DUF805 domain-containing protein [Fulvivirga marina]MBL6447834.1 DUF805 domain-containing protein [Fulvivirga marina]